MFHARNRLAARLNQPAPHRPADQLEFAVAVLIDCLSLEEIGRVESHRVVLVIEFVVHTGIDGDAVILSSGEVENPVAFRFAWDKSAEPNLTYSCLTYSCR